MSTAVSGMKLRAPKPWDKLRRHVRSGVASQPASPGSPAGDHGPFHVLRDGKLHELKIANAGGAAPSARHSEPTKGAGAHAELTEQTAPAQARATSTPPSRVYARSESAPGASSAPRDSADKTHVRPGALSRRSKSTFEATSAPGVSSSDPRSVPRSVPKSGASAATGDRRNARPDADGDAFQWLLTRQLEAEMSLRGAPPNTPKDVEATRATFASFCAFFDALEEGARAAAARRVSEKHASANARAGPSARNGLAGFLVPAKDVPASSVLACERFALFQELTRRAAGFADVSEHRRDGAVPPHRARDAALREVDTVLGAEVVRDMAATVRRMRAVLRVKMEDANDVRMAAEAVRGARLFFDTLRRHAEKEGKEDLEVLRALREA